MALTPIISMVTMVTIRERDLILAGKEGRKGKSRILMKKK